MKYFSYFFKKIDRCYKRTSSLFAKYSLYLAYLIIYRETFLFLQQHFISGFISPINRAVQLKP